MGAAGAGALEFEGAAELRLRLVCSLLSGRAVRVGRIRAGEARPGLREHEASLLRLLCKVSNGTVVQINETGTALYFRPGILTGGAGLSHDCGRARAIGYFLEPLMLLAPFSKKPVECRLQGITNDDVDPSVDCFQRAGLPLLGRFGEEAAGTLKALRRGFRPGGGGEVQVRLPVSKGLQQARVVDEGMVRRVRGIAYAGRTAAQNTNRLVDGARGVLNNLLADVYIFTDHMPKDKAGESPGYGLTLVAETNSGLTLCAERCTGGIGEQRGGASAAPEVPEDLGQACAKLLLEEVSRGGVVDSSFQGALLLLCAVGQDTLHQVRLGPLTPHAVHVLRHIKDFFGVVFNLSPEQQSKTIFASCIGANVKNLAKGAR